MHLKLFSYLQLPKCASRRERERGDHLRTNKHRHTIYTFKTCHIKNYPSVRQRKRERERWSNRVCSNQTASCVCTIVGFWIGLGSIALAEVVTLSSNLRVRIGLPCAVSRGKRPALSDHATVQARFRTSLVLWRVF